MTTFTYWVHDMTEHGDRHPGTLFRLNGSDEYKWSDSGEWVRSSYVFPKFLSDGGMDFVEISPGEARRLFPQPPSSSPRRLMPPGGCLPGTLPADQPPEVPGVHW